MTRYLVLVDNTGGWELPGDGVVSLVAGDVVVLSILDSTSFLNCRVLVSHDGGAFESVPKVSQAGDRALFEITFAVPGPFVVSLRSDVPSVGELHSSVPSCKHIGNERHYPPQRVLVNPSEVLDDLRIVTVLSRCLDTVDQWPSLLSAQSSVYNFVHFTPLQPSGSSGSSYSLSDQTDPLDDSYLPQGMLAQANKDKNKKKFKFSKLKEVLETLSKEHHLSGVSDLVLNHTAHSSPWLSSVPHATYNLLHEPHLRLPFLIDVLLTRFSDGLYLEGMDFIERLLIAAHTSYTACMDVFASLYTDGRLSDLKTKLKEREVFKLTDEEDVGQVLKAIKLALQVIIPFDQYFRINKELCVLLFEKNSLSHSHYHTMSSPRRSPSRSATPSPMPSPSRGPPPTLTTITKTRTPIPLSTASLINSSYDSLSVALNESNICSTMLFAEDSFSQRVLCACTNFRSECMFSAVNVDSHEWSERVRDALMLSAGVNGRGLFFTPCETFKTKFGSDVDKFRSLLYSLDGSIHRCGTETENDLYASLEGGARWVLNNCGVGTESQPCLWTNYFSFLSPHDAHNDEDSILSRSASPAQFTESVALLMESPVTVGDVACDKDVCTTCQEKLNTHYELGGSSAYFPSGLCLLTASHLNCCKLLTQLENSCANNGWVAGWDCQKDFAASGSLVYLCRHLFAWGDCVKLRYGSSPDSCPALWSRMAMYVAQSASLFSAVRLDNCHSTPLHVASRLLRLARRVKPDLLVVAELFTGEEKIDFKFVQTLGISMLIRELCHCHSASDLVTAFTQWRQGSITGGSLPDADDIVHSDRVGVCLQRSKPFAVMFDSTHDNETPFELRRPHLSLPYALTAFAFSGACGSNYGFDQSLFKMRNVVSERRKYYSISDSVPTKALTSASSTDLNPLSFTVPDLSRDSLLLKIRADNPFCEGGFVVGGWDDWTNRIPLQRLENDHNVWYAVVNNISSISKEFEFKFALNYNNNNNVCNDKDVTWVTSSLYPEIELTHGNVNNIVSLQEQRFIDESMAWKHDVQDGLYYIKKSISKVRSSMALFECDASVGFVLDKDVAVLTRTSTKANVSFWFIFRVPSKNDNSSSQVGHVRNRKRVKVYLDAPVRKVWSSGSWWENVASCEQASLKSTTHLERGVGDLLLKEDGLATPLAALFGISSVRGPFVDVRALPLGGFLVFETAGVNAPAIGGGLLSVKSCHLQLAMIKKHYALTLGDQLRSEMKKLNNELKESVLPGLTFEDVSYLLYSIGDEELDRTKGTRGLFIVPKEDDHKAFVFAGISSIAFALRQYRSYGWSSLGPLHESVVTGDWLANYCLQRLQPGCAGCNAKFFQTHSSFDLLKEEFNSVECSCVGEELKRRYTVSSALGKVSQWLKKAFLLWRQFLFSTGDMAGCTKNHTSTTADCDDLIEEVVYSDAYARPRKSLHKNPHSCNLSHSESQPVMLSPLLPAAVILSKETQHRTSQHNNPPNNRMDSSKSNHLLSESQVTGSVKSMHALSLHEEGPTGHQRFIDDEAHLRQRASLLHVTTRKQCHEEVVKFGLVFPCFDFAISNLFERCKEHVLLNMMRNDKVKKALKDTLHGGHTLLPDLAIATLQLYSYLPSAPLCAQSPVLASHFLSDGEKEDVMFKASISAGLPHFASGYMRSWGRDTFIAMPGLLSVNGRISAAQREVLGFARIVRHGLIPNLLDGGSNPRYNARDAVWFFLKGLTALCVSTDVKSAKESVKVDEPTASFLGTRVMLRYPIDDAFGGKFSDLFPELNLNADNNYNDYLGDKHKIVQFHPKVQREPAIRQPECGSGPIVSMPLFLIVIGILRAHSRGIQFREWEAGTKIDSQMVDQGFNIQVGADYSFDGFLTGGNESNCGTWMDKMGSSAKAGNKGVPATCRTGAPVEIMGLAANVLHFVSEVFHSKDRFAKLKNTSPNKAPSSITQLRTVGPDSDSNDPLISANIKNLQMILSVLEPQVPLPSPLPIKTWAAMVASNLWKKYYVPVDSKWDRHFNVMTSEVRSTRGLWRDTACNSNDPGVLWRTFQVRCNAPVAIAATVPILLADQNNVALAKLTLAVLRRFCKTLVVIGSSLGIKTLSTQDPLYQPYYDNADDSENFSTAHGLSYHNGPEWVWPLGLLCKAMKMIALSLEKVPADYQQAFIEPWILEELALFEKQDGVIHTNTKGVEVTQQLINEVFHRAALHVKSNSWQSLPELTNHAGQYCPFSCPTQAWSVATFIEAMSL